MIGLLLKCFPFIFRYVNAWISVKGCIEVVPSNLVSTGSCDIVVYWGYGLMDHVWSLLFLLRHWMSYGYTVCMLGRAPRTNETLPEFFCENMNPDKRGTTMWHRVTRNPLEFRGLTGCQRDPRIWGVTNKKHFLVKKVKGK